MPSTTTQTPPRQQDGAALSHGLKQRHLSMIALGGVIGAGLFVGSGAGIAAAGPSIVIAYAVSGLLVMLVMRMLGEMSAAYPSSGSFSAHAERAMGPWAGFTAGWSFWVLLCTAVGLEGIGAAHIVTGWLPGTPEWAWVALFMVVFCGANLAAVKNFGEFEFWFAALKVGAISLFLDDLTAAARQVVHAFYLQYRNQKVDFVEAMWRVVNWQDVARRYAAARSRADVLLLTP